MVKTTRREFLKQVAIAGAAVTALPGTVLSADGVVGARGKSRVVLTTDAAALKGDVVSQKTVENMLGRGIAKLTGKSTASDGWKQLFKPNDVVGIKVNCLFGKGVSTRPEVVNAIIAGLRQAGVKPDNIIVWDRSTSDLLKCGFVPNKDGAGVKYYADDGDWGPEVEQGTFKGRVSKVIMEKATAIINAPVLKTHGLTGYSNCLKNHYGSMDNPGQHHKTHNTALADFSAIPQVRNKTRLVVVDALRPQVDGGPGLKQDAQFDYHTMMVSRDPLAADYQGLQIINKQRSKMGLDPLPEKKLEWLRVAQERGVGVSDPAKIELVTA